MNRRTAIRNVVFISAGASLLPSCMGNDATAIPLKNISVTGSQVKMLTDLTESIIPKTSGFIGASDLKAHEFILTMIDDCSGPEDQKHFTDGLQAFDKLSHDKYGQLFTGYTAEQKRSLLSDIEKGNAVPEEAVRFYKTVKRYTLQCFTSSREYMTGIRKYKMVPGPVFKGCVPVTSA